MDFLSRYYIWAPSLLQTLDVVMRVPPLFVLDSVFNGTLTVPWVPDDRIKFLGIGTTLFSSYGLVMLLTCCFCLVLIGLSTKHMIYVYSILLAFGILLVSYAISDSFISNHVSIRLESNRSDVVEFVTCVSAHIVLAFCYDKLIYGIDENIIPTLRLSTVWRSLIHTYLLFVFPVIVSLFVPYRWSQFAPAIFIALAGAELGLALCMCPEQLVVFFHDAYVNTRYRLLMHGIVSYVEGHWRRLHVPMVLRTFWITRAVFHFSFILGYRLVADSTGDISADDVLIAVKLVLYHGCETCVALLGMTSIVSRVAHYAGEVVLRLVGCAQDVEREIGTMTAILFLILALQTGLTSMEDSRRLTRLYRNVWLLGMAVLHFLHGTLHKRLMELSAGRHEPMLNHVRAISVCVTMTSLAVVLVQSLWVDNPIGTWLLAVTAFCIELVVKMIISLLIYTLFMINSYRADLWEGLDDYIYCIKSTGSTIEFLFGIFLFGNGAWIMLFESGGVIRAFMMCTHAYFNIYVQGKEGWKTFMMRRTAVRKIDSLANATTEQITSYNDVCAICYQELHSARVTACRHMFHGVCLRKWLYIQDKCPLCHQNIYATDTGDTGTKKVTAETVVHQ